MREAITEQAILEIYHDTLDELYGYVSRRCSGDRALAEDVTQEAWLRAVRVWRTEGLPRQPIAWLKTVARNVLLNRRRGVRPLSLDATAASGTALVPAADQRLEQTETDALVRRALARLPVSRAQLLVRFHCEGQSVAQIAANTGVSERAIEGRLRRARQRLRQEIDTLNGAEGGHT